MTDVDLNTVVANERAAIPAASLKTIGTFFPSVTLKCSFIIFLKRAKNRTGLTGFPKAHSSSGPEQRVMMTSLQILFAALSAHDKWHISPFAVLTLSGNLNHVKCCFSAASITQNGIFFRQ